MFGIFFGWTKASKCKKAIKAARCRLIHLKNKRKTIALHLRNDLTELILNGYEEVAINRVEVLIQDESLVAAYEMLDQFFEFILHQLSYIRKHKDCPTDINEAVSSIIFASARFGDFPELYPIRKLFAQRYGKDFATAALDLLPGNLVNTKLKEILSVKSVTDDLKYRVVDEIAMESSLQTKVKEYKGSQLIVRDSQIIHTKGSKIHSPSKFDQEIETDVTPLSFTTPSDAFSPPKSSLCNSSTSVSPIQQERVEELEDIDECEYISSKDGCSEDQRLVLFNSSESDMDRDESSSDSSIRTYTSRKRASKKRLRRRSPLLERQGIVEIGYTLHYQTPSPQSSNPKKRLKQHSYSDSCERNSLDFNMSDCSCNLDSPCYCSVYNEIEMFEYLGRSSSSTNAFNPNTCDCLTTTPYSRALTTPPSKLMGNYNDNLLRILSCPSPRPKHVHPKLPDYDDFVATLMALQREFTLRAD